MNNLSGFKYTLGYHVILRNPDLSPNEKVLYFIIRSLPPSSVKGVVDTNLRYMSLKYLASLSRLSVRTTQKYINRLVENGFLLRKSGNSTEKLANVYTLTAPSVWKIKPVDGFKQMTKSANYKDSVLSLLPAPSRSTPKFKPRGVG